MCRSSRLTGLVVFSLLLPSSAGAQLYGFPSDVGVVDDGYGVLPPTGPSLPTSLPESLPDAAPLPPLVLPRPAPPPCPLVIKVGRGLQRPAQARIVYGRPTPCS